MVRRRLAWILTAAATLAGPVCGQSATADDEPLLAIKGARLIDGTGAEPVGDAIVVIHQGRFRTVGTRRPTGATLLDLGNVTLLPGFIDCHTHLTGRYIGEGDDWQNSRVRDLPQEDAIRGVRNAWQTLVAGFTTVRNVGAMDYSDVALRNMIEAGVVPGPRMQVSAHALGITGGHCDDNGFNPGVADRGPDAGIADGEEEIVQAARTQIKRGADLIKFCATGGVLSEGDAVGVQQYTLEEMQVLVDTVHLLDHKVTAHAHGNDGIKAALRAGVDSIEHGSRLDDEAIDLFLQTGAYLVPTLMAQEAVETRAGDGTLTGLRAEKARFIAPLARESFTRAAAAGVKIALGSDAGVFPHGTQGREFVLMVENGMAPMEAIVAGTREGATLLGLAEELGTVERGKIADLVAVRGNPLRDIEAMTRVVFVVKDGKVVVNKVEEERAKKKDRE